MAASDSGPPCDSFSSFPIHSHLKRNIELLGLTQTFPIQARAIPHLLNGRDLLASAKTGSGKTLAFLIPAINYLLETPETGLTVLVIAPTRELALQTHDVASSLLKDTSIRHGLLIGGTQKKKDDSLLSRGVSLLVATPGRLVDHILTNPGFDLSQIRFFVIDEADRVLESGFKVQLDEIIKNLPGTRQTALFSATQTTDVQALASVCLKPENLVHCGVDDDSETSTVAGLSQAYVITPSNQRLMLLVTFLRRNKKKKVMVFFSTKLSVKFHQLLFKELNMKCLAIHGDQSQQKRIEAFNQFKADSFGVLLCTDVAARGLDIPAVEWIVQFDPPASEKEYIHRVGRSARAGAQGRALLFLMENEKGFLRYLEEAKVEITELKFPPEKVMNLDLLIAQLMNTNRKLLKAAKEALKAYLMSYESHALNDCFNVCKLDVEGVAKSFGFDEMPHLDIRITTGKQTDGSWIEKEKRKQQSVA